MNRLKAKHCYVVLIDLPEALPFEIRPSSKLSELATLGQNSLDAEKELFKFVSKLEKNFKEEFSFIGEDIVGAKFYKRFLFPKSGFMEIMYQAPIAIIAHFLDTKRADKFAQALKKTLRQTVKDRKVLTILQNMVEVNTEKEEPLTYEKWSKLREIRGLVK